MQQASNQTFLDRCRQWLARQQKSLDQLCRQLDAEYQIPRPAAAQHLPAFQAATRLLGVCGEAATLVFCGFLSAFLFVKSSHWFAISVWVEIAAHRLGVAAGETPALLKIDDDEREVARWRLYELIISRSTRVKIVMKAKQTDTEIAVEQAQQWADELGEIAELISERFSRAEARERAVTYLRGLLSPVERKNGWQLAEESGDETPYATQHLLGRAVLLPLGEVDEERQRWLLFRRSISDPTDLVKYISALWRSSGASSADSLRIVVLS